MTKRIFAPGNPRIHQTLNRMNSIVAAAKTAHDLESARRGKQKEAPPLRSTRSGQIRTSCSKSQCAAFALISAAIEQLAGEEASSFLA
jgi:hypothetical protein